MRIINHTAHRTVIIISEYHDIITCRYHAYHSSTSIRLLESCYQMCRHTTAISHTRYCTSSSSFLHASIVTLFTTCVCIIIGVVPLLLPLLAADTLTPSSSSTALTTPSSSSSSVTTDDESTDDQTHESSLAEYGIRVLGACTLASPKVVDMIRSYSYNHGLTPISGFGLLIQLITSHPLMIVRGMLSRFTNTHVYLE